jgi:hypothetical protein
VAPDKGAQYERSRSEQFARRAKQGRRRDAAGKDYFLRWRILARMRRFLRPSFRRPLPDFLTPKADSVFGCKAVHENDF